MVVLVVVGTVDVGVGLSVMGNTMIHLTVHAGVGKMYVGISPTIAYVKEI